MEAPVESNKLCLSFFIVMKNEIYQSVSQPLMSRYWSDAILIALHCLPSDSASLKPGKRGRATPIIFVMVQCG